MGSLESLDMPALRLTHRQKKEKVKGDCGQLGAGGSAVDNRDDSRGCSVISGRKEK